MKKYSRMYLNENSNDLLGILEESLLNKIKDGVINTIKKKTIPITIGAATGSVLGGIIGGGIDAYNGDLDVDHFSTDNFNDGSTLRKGMTIGASLGAISAHPYINYKLTQEKAKKAWSPANLLNKNTQIDLLKSGVLPAVLAGGLTGFEMAEINLDDPSNLEIGGSVAAGGLLGAGIARGAQKYAIHEHLKKIPQAVQKIPMPQMPQIPQIPSPALATSKNKN